MYDDEFLSDLTGLLSAGAIKKTDDDPLDFQVGIITAFFSNKIHLYIYIAKTLKKNIYLKLAFIFNKCLLFQPQQLVNKIKQCSVLEADTQMKLKKIHDSHLELSDADALCANLKGKWYLLHIIL